MKKQATFTADLISWIRRKVATKIPMWPAWRGKSASWGPSNFRDLVRDAYKGNVYASSNINRISYGVASLPWRAETEDAKGGPVELPKTDPLYQLWMNPNRLALLTGNLFRRHITNVLTLAGESHILKISENLNAKTSLRNKIANKEGNARSIKAEIDGLRKQADKNR